MSSIGHIFNIYLFIYLEGITERESMESLQECCTFFQLFRNFSLFHQIDIISSKHFTFQAQGSKFL